MKKILLSFFVIFTLLLAPIAHAFDVSCNSDNCQMAEQVKKESKSEKQQDNNKMANAEHHCCCPHILAIPNLTVVSPMATSSQTVFVLERDATTSVVVGPPLKPPSHA